MNMRYARRIAGAASLSLMLLHTSAAESLRDFQKRAGDFHNLISIPQFEQTTNTISDSVERTIRDADAALNSIAALAPEKTTFANTVVALDDLAYSVSLAINRFILMKETSQEPQIREAATQAVTKLQQWAVGIDYREDVFRALKAFANRKPRLKGEDAKLLTETMRDYRRAGLDLPPSERTEVERLRKELTSLGMQFEGNVTKAEKALKFSRQELAGVPDDFLQKVKTGENEFTVMANITWHYVMVLDNATSEETRKRLFVEHDKLAAEENVPLLQKIVPLRAEIARRLGYKTWADFQTEIRMAKNGQTAIDFLNNLKVGLQPKFDAELAEFRRLKSAETGTPNPTIYGWDWRHYSTLLKKEKYAIDAEQLRVYFPYDRALEGMFRIYQDTFSLKFQRMEPPWKWVEDLQLFAVSDSRTGEPLGLFYLDMFPRQGKFNHFAQFDIITGKRISKTSYQRPTVALVCNFPPPANGQPSLLSHSDVETLFHEFGHAMHSLLTRGNYRRFSGTSVPMDFVEAPSQLLENWVWDKAVLDTFAADYRDPSKKIPADILAKLKESKLATEGTRYRRQLAFGLTDLELHARINSSNATEIVPLSNKILEDVFLPTAPGTAFVGYFGHLAGYDAGYYSYAWADAISADLATVFDQSSRGYFDKKAGLKLRNEIYAPGDSRPVADSIQKFLGRERSIKPFLRRLGIAEKK